MYSSQAFGNYYPSNSKIHKISPFIKLLNLIFTILILVLSINLYTNVFLLSLTFLMTLLSLVPFMYYFNAFYMGRYLYIIIMVLSFIMGYGLDVGLVYVIKLIIIIQYLFLLTYTTSNNELNIGIQKFLFPLRIIGINTKRISMFIVNIIKFIPALLDTRNKILKSAESRGIDYNNSDIIGRLYAAFKTNSSVVRITFNKIKKNREYEKSRLFSFKKKRINYKKYSYGFYTIMITLFHVTIFVIALMERGYFNEILNKFML